MSHTVELMDAAKAAAGIGSDYRLAQVLGVTRGTVSNWRLGRSFPTYSSTCTLASMAGTDPGAALLGVGIDRQNTPAKLKTLRSIGRAMLAEADAAG